MGLRNKNFSQNRSFKNLLLLYLWGQQSPKVPKFFETLQENFPLLLLWGRYEHLLVNFPSYFLGGDGLSEFQRIFLKLFSIFSRYSYGDRCLMECRNILKFIKKNLWANKKVLINQLFQSVNQDLFPIYSVVNNLRASSTVLNKNDFHPFIYTVTCWRLQFPSPMLFDTHVG